MANRNDTTSNEAVEASAEVPSSLPTSHSGLGYFHLLVPFDVGTTYVFSATGNPEEEWKRFVEVLGKQAGGREKASGDRHRTGAPPAPISGSWCFDPLPRDRFHSPFGYSVTLKFSTSHLKDALSSLCFMQLDSSAQATIFPMGIGVLRVSASLKEDSGKAYQCMVKNRSRVKDLLKAPLGDISAQFTLAMAETMKVARPKNVRILHETKREPQFANFGYSVLFPQDSHSMPKTSEKAGKFEYKTPEGASADVSIYWADAIVTGSDEQLGKAIVNGFFVAITCWYALNVMNRITTRKVNELMFGPRGKRKAELGRQARMLGISYFEAGSLSTPIHWAREDNDLRLLQAIHRRWCSDGWWTQVKERIATLTAYHEKLEDEATGLFERNIAILGALIALFVVPSAIKDVYDLEDHVQQPCWLLVSLHAHPQTFLFGIPIAIILLLVGYLLFGRKR